MNKLVKMGEERVVYSGKIIEVVQSDVLLGDKSVIFEKVRRAPGVRLIIVTPNNKIKITKEYRDELGEYDYRLPGGKVFDLLEDFNFFIKSGGDIVSRAEEVARIEAREEVGIKFEKAELLGVSKAGATIEWDLYYFLINEYEELGSQDLGEGEIISVEELDFKEAWDMCLSGKLKEDRSVSRLLQFLYKRM